MELRTVRQRDDDPVEKILLFDVDDDRRAALRPADITLAFRHLTLHGLYRVPGCLPVSRERYPGTLVMITLSTKRETWHFCDVARALIRFLRSAASSDATELSRCNAIDLLEHFLGVHMV